MNNLEHDLKRDLKLGCPKRSCQYLTTFAFIRNDYGVRVSIVGCMELVKFPTQSDFVKGYIELRGDKIAIVDPGVLLGKNPMEVSQQTCLVLSEFEVAGQKTKLGVLIGDISEVLCIASHSSSCKEQIPSSANVEFVLKLGSSVDMQDLLKRIGRTMKENRISTKLYGASFVPV